MRVFPNEFGVNCALQPAEGRPGIYYADPTVIVALIKGERYDSMSVRVDPQYGVSISLGHRPKKRKDTENGV